MRDLQTNLELYGKAGRYVYLLERELQSRKTRRSTLIGSLVLNIVLIAVFAWEFLA